MTTNNLVLFAIVIIVVLLAWYYVFDKCTLCSICGSKLRGHECPTCVVTQNEAKAVLRQLAKGCTNRLRGVIREDLATQSDISAFMSGGNSRLVIITNIDPENFARIVISGADRIDELTAVAITSNIVAGAKNYIVMTFSDGSFSVTGAPTNDFVTAFNNLEASARKVVGPDTNNLVFYIDEDIPCGAVPSFNDVVYPEQTPLDETGVEKCCGRRY